VAKLVVRKGRNIGTDYKLNGDRLIMGRRSACPIPVLDPKSSREHAVILRKDEQFFLQDLSRNGTFLNGKNASKDEASPSPLKFGDQIRIGDTVMEVVDEKTEAIQIEIPGYKIQEKIGVGGMGVVYKAKQLSMDRIVALKVLNEKYSIDREFVDRFIREARAAGKLNHPNVIHVHDVSKANGRHYFSMEFIDGSSVKEMLRIQGRVKLEQALDIVVQTAKALEFAHENQIVHRDIKPDNIMLTKDGVVKIADLGIAKTFEETGPAAKQNRRVMGTPHYMAPEQALGKDIDHRVDVYALGATLYHMLTGTTPFSGQTAHEVLKAHIQESLPPVQEYAPEVPDPVCFIVERMMAKLPEKRYPNMTRLIEDLDRSQKGVSEGIERIATGDSTIMRAMTGKEAEAYTKKKKKAEGTEHVSTGIQQPVKNMIFYVGLVVLFLVVVGLVVTIARPSPNSNPPPPPAPSPGSSSSGAATSSGNTGGPPVVQGNVEADKLLTEAKGLLAGDPVSAAAEAKLQEVTSKYAAAPAADEARKLIEGIANSKAEARRSEVRQAVEAARKFEADNKDDGSKLQAVLDKWRAVLPNAEIAPDYQKEAQGKVDEWTRRIQGEAQRNFAAAWQQAAADSDAASGRKDFEAARGALAAFINAHAAAPQKADAQKKLGEVDAAADAAFNQAKTAAQNAEKDKTRAIPHAMQAWDEYLRDVKDPRKLDEAKAARADLNTRATGVMQDAGGKIAEKVKQYDYDGAVALAKSVQQQLTGVQPFENFAKEREKELVLQRELHEKVVNAIKEKTKAGPLALPFKADIKLLKDQTQFVRSAEKDRIEIAAEGGGVSQSTKFGVLKPAEQYEVYKLFLGEMDKLTPEDHKALAAFCKERGLNDDAALHESKAKGQ